MPLKILAVKAKEECEEEGLEEEDIDEEEAALNSLNAIRIQRGKTPFKKFPKSNGNRKQRSTTQDDKWGADEVQILREVWTHAEGMLQTDQRKRSNDHRARQTVQSQ